MFTIPAELIGIDDYPVVDLLLRLDRLPTPDEGVSARGRSWQGGGKVATAVCAAGRLGVSVDFVGIVGDDALGRFLREDFIRHGVGTQRLISQPGAATILNVVLSQQRDNSRSFIGTPGSCRRLELSDIGREHIHSAKLLHLWQMTEVGRQAARWAKEAGVTVSFDGDYYDEAIHNNLDLTDVFIISEYYYRSAFSGGSVRET